MEINKLQLNPNNPQRYTDDEVKQLAKSIEQFPKMMKLRPIVYDPATNYVLGGNKRLAALIDMGYDTIPDEWIRSADELTEDEKHRFIVQDNIQHGEWDFEELRDNWDVDELGDWGLEIPEITEPSDQQPEPNVFDGFTVVMKIDSETMPKVEKKLNELADEHGFEIDIS